MDILFVVVDVIFDEVFNRFEVVVGHLLYVLDLLGRVNVEVVGQFLKLFLDDRIRGFGLNWNNFVLKHVEQPL